jgi:hypothetical protein
MPHLPLACLDRLVPSLGRHASGSVSTFFMAITLLAGAALMPSTALAQSESYILGPGSNIGPSTKIKPTNCKQAADGTVTCDTKVVNPPGDTPAKPIYSPFTY